MKRRARTTWRMRIIRRIRRPKWSMITRWKVELFCFDALNYKVDFHQAMSMFFSTILHDKGEKKRFIA